jgi:phosphoribosylformimino-5-aminoimidazole carboxamide ribotide isomerase
MRVIPAIDLLDGRAVRLRAGKKDDVTVYRERPEELVGELAAGRRRADPRRRSRRRVRRRAAARRRDRADVRGSPVPIQVGGGIRDAATARAVLDAGRRGGGAGHRGGQGAGRWSARCARRCPAG